MMYVAVARLIFRNLFILVACQLKIIRVVLQLQHNNQLNLIDRQITTV